MTQSPKVLSPQDRASDEVEALAKQQGVGPIDDVRSLFGTWPGEPDDGFEEGVDRLRTRDQIEDYTPERVAEFLLGSAIDQGSYQEAVEEVREMGLDPEKIDHFRWVIG